MIKFDVWKIVRNSLEEAKSQPPKEISSEDLSFDHYYTVKVPPIDNWRNIKEIIEKQVKSVDLAFYPSNIYVIYKGIDKKMIFHILGLLRREINDKIHWLPPQGVYMPRKVVDTQMASEN